MLAIPPRQEKNPAMNISFFLHPGLPPQGGNGAQLSLRVIASAAKQSLFSAEIASSLTLLAMTAFP
jgi:hypothetical protein